jgi:hypothetical protein
VRAVVDEVREVVGDDEATMEDQWDRQVPLIEARRG